MRASRSVPCRVVCAALLLAGGAARAWAWDDPFGDWSAHGYMQLLEINRPAAGLPPTGDLDSYGDGAAGYTKDGPQFRILDVGVSGPLGWPGWSAVLESQVYLSTASLTNFYVQWSGGFGALRAGNVYLPFGAEQQASFKDLIGIQRGLLYGFENYGHTQDWGLQLMSQRGWGLRWDRGRSLGPLTWTAQAGLQDFQGGALYQNALGAVARTAAAWARGATLVQAGVSGLLARGQLLTPPPGFAPLGAAEGTAFAPSADLSGHRAIAAWGPDLEAGDGPVHVRVELAEQTLDGLPRGGGQATAWLDLDAGLRALGAPSAWRAVRVYGKWEQVSSSFGDGVHQAGALYRAATYGLGLPTGWSAATLRLEYLLVSSDSFGGAFPDGRILQAELQFAL